jgi:MFS family permease
VSGAFARTFDSLSIPNYRRYFGGQVVSLSGNWMQTVAEVWLILSLTGSGLAVGVTTALQFLPIMLLGAWGGAVVDRFSTRRILIVTQALMILPPLALVALTATGAVVPWMVFATVFVRGVLIAVDNPARQAFVMEMVGSEKIVNAVSLNSVIVHSARIVGPAVAGIMIATIGVVACFALNVLTFLVMIRALAGMDEGRLEAPPRSRKGERGVRDAIAYVKATPGLLVPLVLMAVVGTLGLNFHVVLPLLASMTFEAGASSYALLVSAMGVGSVAGALVTGARQHTGLGLIAGSSLAFGAMALLAASMPTLASELPVLALLGASAVTFAAAVNSTLQLVVAPEMRARVMALYTVVFLGSTPIGGPLAGWLSEAWDPRAALLMASFAGLIAAGSAFWILSGRTRWSDESVMRGAGIH